MSSSIWKHCTSIYSGEKKSPPGLRNFLEMRSSFCLKNQHDFVHVDGNIIYCEWVDANFILCKKHNQIQSTNCCATELQIIRICWLDWSRTDNKCSEMMPPLHQPTFSKHSVKATLSSKVVMEDKSLNNCMTYYGSGNFAPAAREYFI